MTTIKPASVHGPVVASNVRVVFDGSTVAIVRSGPSVQYLQQTGESTSLPGGKVTIPTTEGNLNVVKQGGCGCGKPWLNRPNATELMAGAPEYV